MFYYYLTDIIQYVNLSFVDDNNLVGQVPLVSTGFIDL